MQYDTAPTNRGDPKALRCWMTEAAGELAMACNSLEAAMIHASMQEGSVVDVQKPVSQEEEASILIALD